MSRFAQFSFVFFVLLGVGAYYYLHEQELPAPFVGHTKTQKVLPKFGKVGDFSLVNADGKDFSSSSLEGKVWVANFMFTHCQGPCPMMTKRQGELHQAFRHAANFRQVSISIDPSRDTPKVLHQYAQKHGADLSRWWFLTGELDGIIHIARNLFKVPADKNPETHSTRFILVDPKGEVRGYYDSSSSQDLEQLEADIRLMTSGHSMTS